jgi:hypothetical protein
MQYLEFSCVAPPQAFVAKAVYNHPKLFSNGMLAQDSSKTEIMRQLWPPQSKNGFSIFMPEENPAKFLFLKPNTLSDVMIVQNFPEKVNFPGILSIPNHHNPNTSLR